MSTNRQYRIEYSKEINTQSLLKEGDLIIVRVDTYLGDENNILILNVDTNNMYDKNETKIEGYNDYQIGILPGDGKFIKKDGTLKIGKFRHSRCNGCTTWISKKRKTYKKDGINYTEYASYPEDKLAFKICKGENPEELIPIKLVGKVEKIDSSSKYIDISIADYYKLHNRC